MVKTYWALFILSIMGSLIGIVLICLGIVFAKRWFFAKTNGFFPLILFFAFFLAITIFSIKIAINSYKDYDYVVSETYIEGVGTVIEFMDTRRDLDGNGQINPREPKFYFHDTEQTIVLHAKDVELGETYRIRYYPNTKICEVIEVVPQAQQKIP